MTDKQDSTNSDKAAGITTGKAVYAVNPAHCLRYRHAASECARCSDACSAKAVELPDGQPVINAKNCTQCGACLDVCPAEAIETSVPVNDSWFTEAMRHILTEGGACTLACSKVKDAPEGSIKMPCLQTISAAKLAGLAAVGAKAVHFYSTDCAKCRLGNAARGIKVIAEDAAKIISPAGTAPEFLFSQAKGGDAISKERRGFFGRLLKPLAEDPVKPAAEAEHIFCTDYYVNPEGEDQPVHMPTGRVQLVSALKRIAENAASNTGTLTDHPAFLVPLVTSDCVACGVCALTCPTGALLSTTEGPEGNETVTMTLLAKNCTSCGLCKDVCYRSAVTMNPVSLKALFADTPAVIYTNEDKSGSMQEDSEKEEDVPVYRT